MVESRKIRCDLLALRAVQAFVPGGFMVVTTGGI